VRLLLPLLLILAWGAAADTLDDYLSLVTGSFTSTAQAETDSRYDDVTWHIAEIWPDDDRVRWLYTESWMAEADAPYMQRIARIEQRKGGTLLARRFLLPDAKNFVGAWQTPARFSALEPDALTELTGCEAVLVRAGENRFEGGTRGNDCKNTFKGASFAISQGVVSADEMVNWDRGFNAQGEIVWGPAWGGYRFRRADEKDACTKPVRMLVYASIDDRKQLGVYGRAIAESGLYRDNGGYYEAVTPALEVFEGNPPASRGVIIARFPCLAAAQRFWYSDVYQNEIRPLRDGIAEFEVIVLPAPPLPEWAP
jgi:uncharacterized protein (DUF1330 family)